MEGLSQVTMLKINDVSEGLHEKAAKQLFFNQWKQYQEAVRTENVEKIQTIGELLDQMLKDKKEDIILDYCTEAEKEAQKIEDNTYINKNYSAFYCAIRDNNAELLAALVETWPLPRQRAILLSRAYEDLKLRMVPLTTNIEFYIINKLMHFHMSDSYSNDDTTSVCSIDQRVCLTKDKLNVLVTKFSGASEVNESFLYILTFITKNIYILKRLLFKWLYTRLPWEEIEFCLSIFILIHKKKMVANKIFYSTVLNKTKVMEYLTLFFEKFSLEMKQVEIRKLDDRSQVVINIMERYPEFKGLYEDFTTIKNVYSLDKILNHIDVALKADVKVQDEQLVIIRSLQVIGECLNNSLMSPNLSDDLSQLLLSSLPSNTKEILVDLRCSLSHTHSLHKRKEMEQNHDVEFFTNILDDIKRIKNVVVGIMCQNKMNVLIILLKRFLVCEDSVALNDISSSLKEMHYELLLPDVTDVNKIEMYVKQMSNIIETKTNYEIQLFENIYRILKSPTKRVNESIEKLMLGLMSLKSLNDQIDSYLRMPYPFVMRKLKFDVKDILKNISPSVKEETDSISEVAKSVIKIYDSAKPRLQSYSADNMFKIFAAIISEFNLSLCNVVWIEDLKEKLNRKNTKMNQPDKLDLKIDYDFQINNKILFLQRTLKSYLLHDNESLDYKAIVKDKKIMFSIDLVLLDVLSILLEKNKTLADNSLFLDDNIPLIAGRCLRNYLAHGNILFDVLSIDPNMAVMSNVICLEKFHVDKKSKGRSSLQLEQMFERNLGIIQNQESMFKAIRNGDLENLKKHINAGADIHAMDNNLWNTLHFAAQGPSLDIVKYILDWEVRYCKNINGLSPLHLAADSGREYVQYLLRNLRLNVDETDNFLKTPLHFAAANGHQKTIEIFLQNKADCEKRDHIGNFPIHYAAMYNHLEAVKTLLRGEHVDYFQTSEGCTLLHIAAEKGLMNIVQFLLQNGANVDAKNDYNTRPIHKSSLNGHTEVVKALIAFKADINIRVFDGCTALHYACENGHKDIVDIYLKNKVIANVADKVNKFTPLHYVAMDGCLSIVESLIEYGVNIDAITLNGKSPLNFAAERGHITIVNVLLLNNAAVDYVDEFGNTPIHISTFKGYKDIVEMLIKAKSNLKMKNIDGFTPLHMAVLNGNIDIFKMLLNASFSVGGTLSEELEIFPFAVTNGEKDIVEYLLNNVANINDELYNKFTALYLAAMSPGNDGVSKLLLDQGALIEKRTSLEHTPLHAAVLFGSFENVKCLLEHGADVNTRDKFGNTPIFHAIERRDIILLKALINSGGNLNTSNKNNFTPLCSAIQCNYIEMVKFIIESGADVNAEDGQPLCLAVQNGFSEIVHLLLENNHINVHAEKVKNYAVNEAARSGFINVIKKLHAKGVDIDYCYDGVTPLYSAVMGGHKYVVSFLLEKGANVHWIGLDQSTLLHVATSFNHASIVQVLLQTDIDVSLKDMKDRTAFELSAFNRDIKTIQMFLSRKDIDINATNKNNWTVLHIASQMGHLELIEYMFEHGADVHIKNNLGSKAIHIAAREGHENVVEYFLDHGLNIDDLGSASWNLLHYAVVGGSEEFIQRLIDKGINVNAKDGNGATPIHNAVFKSKNSYNVIKILLNNGSIYNAVDKFKRKPEDICQNDNVNNLLRVTGLLFKAVKRCDLPAVVQCIKDGAAVNALNAECESLLHIASWKGYKDMVSYLLKNKGNPNVVGKGGSRPLHYASKFSHTDIVVSLLAGGAIYNAPDVSQNTPLFYTKDQSVQYVFNLINDIFLMVENKNLKVVENLKKITDLDLLKALFKASNNNNETLIIAAIRKNFPSVERFIEIPLPMHNSKIAIVKLLVSAEKYNDALQLLKNSEMVCEDFFGNANPLTLILKRDMCYILLAQANYLEAFNIIKDIYQQQKCILGLWNMETMRTNSFKAQLYRLLEKHLEALQIYREILPKQQEMLTTNHSDLLGTKINMALVLNDLNSCDEAFKLITEVYEAKRKMHHDYHPDILSLQNNIAMILDKQGRHTESFKLFNSVYELCLTNLGINHSNTILFLRNVGISFWKLKRSYKAIEILKDVQNRLEIIKGPSHVDTLDTKLLIADILSAQRKHISAFKIYTDVIDELKEKIGSDAPKVLTIEIKILRIQKIMDSYGYGKVARLEKLDLCNASQNGDIEVVKDLLGVGVSINSVDDEGRTPLQFAVDSGHLSIIRFLLSKGADALKTSYKGNNLLHTAAFKGRSNIMEILLEHVKSLKYNDFNKFINAKTKDSGMTSLHVAAKYENLNIVKILLTHGAVYNFCDNSNSTPSSCTKDDEIIKIFDTLDRLFECATRGDCGIIDFLKSMNRDDIKAMINAQNTRGKTAARVAISNHHIKFAETLLKILQTL